MTTNLKSDIPKKIHYCWFGGEQLPILAIKCIESWRKYLPDYEIIEWNEGNFDVNCNNYTREAYDSKKWAFVSDYARLKILYEHGGLYFDTDVEIINDMSHIISEGSFMGFETDTIVGPGLGLASAPKLDLYEEILKDYDGSHFLKADGTYDFTTIGDRITRILKEHGLRKTKDIQIVCGVNLYPKDYFNPLDMKTGRLNITQNTVSIHHYMASWESRGRLLRGKVYQFLRRRFGKNIADLVRSIFSHG